MERSSEESRTPVLKLLADWSHNASPLAANDRRQRLRTTQPLFSFCRLCDLISSRASLVSRNCVYQLDWNITGITPIVVDCPALINVVVPPYVPLKLR